MLTACLSASLQKNFPVFQKALSSIIGQKAMVMIQQRRGKIIADLDKETKN